MRFVSAAVLALALGVRPETQTSKPAAPRPQPAPAVPPAAVKEVPQMVCPAPLGVGINTKRAFCDVLAGRDPASGVLITLPPHSGDVTLTFDLSNRHTYSEEQTKDKRAAYARYTASIGVLSMDNTLISRAVVQNEFRGIGDFIDRVGGGAGPGGLKAVAPTGQESIVIVIPEAEAQVSLLGEKLTVEKAEGTATYNSVGRPIAIVSNVMIEYFPPPPPKPPRRPPSRQTPGH